ncbi:MAG: aminotransferase class I/II-fold pyridoxal phosphate-dependent enzyme [Chitinophagaceae bacterium]|nr:aminotransferase class I/II-fold pyridoxal phosphate-dependent enzyme [Chitinophagaceae bacterium]
MYNYPEYALKANEVFAKLDWKNSGQLPVTKVNKKTNKIDINNHTVISFGSSSYLGLHKDRRLIDAGIEAMQKYGILYSSSRSYTYLSMHNELEALMAQMFNKPVLATIQTTMAHFSAMQLLMLPGHGAIIDMQAHATLQNMILLPRALGLKVETILHNDLNMLEAKIKRMQGICKKIWYIADGVYSMYGDTAPMHELMQLLDKYENLYIYFDDAHGMSWDGINGTGFIWKHLVTGHERIVLATSLGKGFGLGGGALICPNQEVKDMMLRAGGSVVFCTQLPVQMLGSGIAAAKIHLTNEINALQDKLKSNIDYFIQLAKKFKLPVIDFTCTPIFFIHCGSQQFGLTLCERLIKNGFYVNVGIYPAVGPKNTGLRISLTALHTKQEITNLVNAIVIQMNILMEEYGLTINDLEKGLRKK